MPKLTLVLLIIGILISLYVNVHLFPEVKKIKQQIASFETAPPDSPARTQFRKLHGISMALNLALLADGAVLIVISSIHKNG
jgi:hypothetical protein